MARTIAQRIPPNARFNHAAQYAMKPLLRPTNAGYGLRTALPAGFGMAIAWNRKPSNKGLKIWGF